MTVPKPALLLAPLFLLLALAGCAELLTSGDGDALHRQRLAEARALWESRGPAAYRFDMDVICACIPTAQRTVRVSVSEGTATVEYIQRAGDEAPSTPPAAYQEFATVEKLFAAVEAAIARDQKVLQVGYDRTYGFPDRMNAVFSGNEQIVFFVGDFRPVTP